jgi:putative ABC transport system permease protein
MRKRIGLLRRTAGAIVHALWLRKQEWSIDLMGQDLKYAFRIFRRRPLFAGIIVATIGLGVGTTTSMFSVVNGILLRPLPFASPEELVMVWEHNLPRNRPTNVVSPANFIAWGERNNVFTGLGALTAISGTLTGDGEPERIGLVMATAEVWPVMGVTPAIGRTFTPEEDLPSAGRRAALLSYGFWQRRFGGSRDVLGRVLTVNDETIEVVGVLPEAFRFRFPYTFDATESMDVWMAHQLPAEARSIYGRWLQVVGRLRQGVSVEQAQAHMESIAARIREERGDAMAGWSANVVPLHQQVVGETERALWIVFAAVVGVLLIACANVAHLLLARSTERIPEIAARTAMGATRTRIVRQLLTESVMLGLVGGVVGMALAFGAVRLTVLLGADTVPRLDEVGIDLGILGFAAGLSLLTGIVFGLVPALQLSRPNLGDALKEGGMRAGTSRGHARLRTGLVVGEVALSLVLLAGAGLLIRSFVNLVETGIGVDAENVLVANVQLPDSRYPEEENKIRAFEDLVSRVSNIPGVMEASAITFAPLTGAGSATDFRAFDKPEPQPGEEPVADIRWVHRDYHRAMGIPLRAGRSFSEADGADGQLVVLISEWMAENIWPNENPLGKTILMEWGDTLVAQVVGVVGDVRHGGPNMESRAKIYWHHVQFSTFDFMTLVARTDRDPMEVLPSIRQAVRDVDPLLPVYQAETVDDLLAEAIAPQRFTLVMLGVFSIVALVLAAIGIYGVISYSVSQQVRELGIRVALGATGRQIVGSVVRRAFLWIGGGLLIGTGVTLLASSLVESMVFEIEPTDPVAISLAAIVLALSALLASYLPARRAGRVDPARTLRTE